MYERGFLCLIRGSLRERQLLEVERIFLKCSEYGAICLFTGLHRALYAFLMDYIGSEKLDSTRGTTAVKVSTCKRKWRGNSSKAFLKVIATFIN